MFVIIVLMFALKASKFHANKNKSRDILLSLFAKLLCL